MSRTFATIALGLLWLSGLAEGERKSVLPLLTTHWHQQSPYNDLCPVIADGNVQTVAGCVAIATSQVVFYWHRDNPDSTSKATPVYPYGKAPVTYSIPAETPFYWERIKNSYTGWESEAERAAVAAFVYIVGTSSWLDYGSSTGGQINEVMSALYSQFRLKSEYASKSAYSQAEWEALLYNELVNGRPIIYSGVNESDGGHAVVIDGYDAQRNQFHFNFGWGGSGDGYYTVDDDTGMNGYSKNQHCVYGIAPMQRNLTVSFDGLSDLRQNEKSSIAMGFANRSTLPIDGLRVYLNRGAGLATASMVFEDASLRIENDGRDTTVVFDVTPSVFGAMCALIVTDSRGNTIASKLVSVAADTGVRSLESGQEGIRVKGVPGGLELRTDWPTTVKVHSVSGKVVHDGVIDGTTTLRLPSGVYVVAGRKYIVE